MEHAIRLIIRDSLFCYMDTTIEHTDPFRFSKPNIGEGQGNENGRGVGLLTVVGEKQEYFENIRRSKILIVYCKIFYKNIIMIIEKHLA